MAKDKTLVDEEKNDKFSFETPKPSKKRISGKVVSITKSRVVIEYGSGLGTSVPYNEKEHSSLKKGDRIEFVQE